MNIAQSDLGFHEPNASGQPSMDIGGTTLDCIHGFWVESHWTETFGLG